MAGAKLPDGSFFSRLTAAYPSAFSPFLRRGGLVITLADWIQHIPRNPTSVHAPSDGLKMVAAYPVQLYGHFHNIQIGSKLDTHDICESSTLAESLGVRIHGITGQVQPTAARDWRLDRTLKALEMRPVITGEQLQVIVGHMTVRALIHRGLMGIIYIFIEQSFEKKQRLWASTLLHPLYRATLIHPSQTNYYFNFYLTYSRALRSVTMNGNKCL